MKGSYENTARRQDEMKLVVETSGDILLEEGTPLTILEEVQVAEMEVTFPFQHCSFSPSIGEAGIRVGCV